jgi:predicted GNAT superfamily acetyltransferase
MNAVDIVVRDIDGKAEMREVEDLQREVWGLPDLDVVPLTQLVAAKASGGVVIGAFDREILAGFAYGFVGYEEGLVTHHSHMLAVRPDYRSFNIGYLLKLAQRERALEQGIERMTWTFDPLQSLNAYFNFNKLGVVSDQYFVNFYGEDAASFLHRNGTDRLWVTWLLKSRHVRERLDGTVPGFEMGNVSPLVEVGKDNAPRCRTFDKGLQDEQAVIEIPADINGLEQKSSEITAEWREATRSAFIEAVAAGYLVDGFHRGNRGDQSVGRYLLKRGESIGDID